MSFLGGHPDEIPLTDEEERAIRSLKRLAKKWPKSLWLWSGAGTLHVMRCGEDGYPVHAGETGGVHSEFQLGTIGIMNDGGDW